MKILIVEDDVKKKKKILDVIKSQDVKDTNIYEVNSVLAAKKLLMEIQFDFMILDVNLPLQDGDEQSLEDGGYIVYREIKESDIFKKPNHIVLLTSFVNLKEKYQAEIESGSFRIIHYSPLELTWSKELASRIKYIQDYNRDKSRMMYKDYDYFAAIVTAVDIEFEACKKIIENLQYEKRDFDDTYYIIGNVKGNPEKKIVLLKQNQKGLTAASVATLKVINNFRPKYLIMPGIAAGVKDATELGDVILATEVVEFTSGKIVSAENFKDIFKPEPKYLNINPEIQGIIHKNFETELVQLTLDKEYEEKGLLPFKTVVGPIVSGPFVLQNDFIIQNFILPYNRMVKSIDMEAYGVIYASENSFTPKPQVIICKAISDFADEDKTDSYQENAALNSAYFVELLMKNHLN